jgi:hypothetical protein
MIQGQFEAAAYKEIDEINPITTNARYAPVGNEKVGMPFPLYKQPAYYFTDWTPAGQRVSNLKREMNLPTDNTTFRNSMQGDGVGLQNKQNNAWLFRTQTLTNNGDTIACRNNTDCASWPGTTCNPQFMSWNDAKGNQGNYCSLTKYPEMESGVYTRKNTTQGGIGKACNSDRECADGYSCNNKTDMFGKNIQQTGFCAQKYSCEDGSTHYLGYPYNSGIPIVPPRTQNNDGAGYASKEQCDQIKLAQQDCKQDNKGRWFATYPGYCPVMPNLRNGGNPQGALPSSSSKSINEGIRIPPFANMKSSSVGKPLQSFSSWNINANLSNQKEMNDPLQYEISINPK